MILRFVNDIRNALKYECYFSALSLALTLPDICGAAEFTEECTIAKRYINWCDSHICQYECEEHTVDGNVIAPYLSGEVIYNLRNNYLHLGCPDVNKAKIKKPENQIDDFILILGEAKKINELSAHINSVNGEVNFKNYMINISYLCNRICDTAEYFYNSNKEKFQMNYKIIYEKDLFE